MAGWLYGWMVEGLRSVKMKKNKNIKLIAVGWQLKISKTK
jgi:hypothetical protein